ncbi:MAG: aldo/keto reductase [Chloroflexota bacterium]
MIEGLLKERVGLGTWNMGFKVAEKAQEVSALRAGIEAGANVIDTAEMYAHGGAEEVTAEAIKGIRDQLFVVTKVVPSNASYDGTIAACESSLKRLEIDVIDLYLLHWKGSHPIQETVNAFEKLVERGLIKRWGVSNFDRQDMENLFTLEAGERCAANQVYYSLSERGVEYDLLPWQEKNGVATMAYCPLDQGRLIHDAGIQPIADKHGVTVAQIALAWLTVRPEVAPIPKSSSVERTIQNVAAREIEFDAEDLERLDQIFPSPDRPTPLKTA